MVHPYLEQYVSVKKKELGDCIWGRVVREKTRHKELQHIFCKTVATPANVYVYMIKCIYLQICVLDYDYG